MTLKWRSKPTCNVALAGRRRGTLTDQFLSCEVLNSLAKSGRCVASQPLSRPSCFGIYGRTIGNTAEIK